MRKVRWKKAAAAIFVLPLIILLINNTSVPALAATGTVYTCTINREYRHPVSGEIEDSGGEAAYATGQGMVEGCVYPDGILEVTDDGQYYLTFRMSLMDYTSNHQFWIQPNGTGDYQSASVGVTQNGTDTNGTTADICVQIPNENTVIRGTMYVEPMGRYVIWYMYPSNFSEGNQTDMVPYAVTETSGSEDNTTAQTADTAGAADDTETTETTDGSTAAATPAPLASASATPAAASPTPTPAATGTVTPGLLKSTIGDATSEGNEAESSAEPIEQAEGLSLSTADESDADDSSSGGSASAGSTFLAVFLGILIAGGVLLFVAFLLVKYILQNYYRWIGGRDDDEYDE